MAIYTKTFTSDGLEKYELVFRNTTFSFEMIYEDDVKKSNKPTFGWQAAEIFEDIKHEALMALDEICFVSDEEILDLLNIIGEDER